MSGQRPGSGDATAASAKTQTTLEPSPQPAPSPTSSMSMPPVTGTPSADRAEEPPIAPPARADAVDVRGSAGPGSGVSRGLNGTGTVFVAGSGGAVTVMANRRQGDRPPSAWTAPAAPPAEGAGGEAQPASWALPGEPASAARARRLTRETMLAWGAGDDNDVEDVVLMVDELVTNAVVHGCGPVALLLHLESGVLTGEVTDGASTLPRLAGGGDSDWGRESGRGLWLVSMLATDHGVRPEADGKTLWFTRVLKN